MSRGGQRDDDRLRRLLGDAQLATLRRRLRARYEQAKGNNAFTLTSLDAAERGALERLLGRTVRSAGSMRMSLEELDAAVARAGLAQNFREALEALDGPIVERKAERAAAGAAWSAAFAAVEDSRLLTALVETDGAALVKRLSRGDPEQGRSLLERVERVLARLPAAGTPLAQLAAETLGDAHALDAGQPVATLVLRTLGVDALERTSNDAGDALGSLQRDPRREQWARVGVTLSELGAPALCLNLRAKGDGVAAVLASTAASAGEPVHLSLRSLLRATPEWDVAERVVYVCENPSIVAVAADRLGAGGAPLVCTDGMPGAAQQTLLRQLVAADAQLRYRGDFDWPGIAIGNFVSRAFGALPWRFSAHDYRAAAVSRGLPLSGRPVRAEWDDALADAMLECGVAIHEESVVDLLMADLAARSAA